MRPEPHRDRGGSHHLDSTAQFCAELRRVGGTPAEVFAYPELLRLVLPMIREDYRLSETYRPDPPVVLHCPVVACCGDEDPDVTPQEVVEWNVMTQGEFLQLAYPGDHFYLVPRLPELVVDLVRIVDRHRLARGWGAR